MAGEYYVTSDNKCEIFSLIDNILLTEKIRREFTKQKPWQRGMCTVIAFTMEKPQLNVHMWYSYFWCHRQDILFAWN